MWERTKPSVAWGDTLLVLVRVQNMHSLADHVAPKRFNELWKGVLAQTEHHVSQLGASVVETDASYPDGSRILCACQDASSEAQPRIGGRTGLRPAWESCRIPR